MRISRYAYNARVALLHNIACMSVKRPDTQHHKHKRQTQIARYFSKYAIHTPTIFTYKFTLFKRIIKRMWL